jgi:hypothetical protein
MWGVLLTTMTTIASCRMVTNTTNRTQPKNQSFPRPLFPRFPARALAIRGKFGLGLLGYPSLAPSELKVKH